MRKYILIVGCVISLILSSCTKKYDLIISGDIKNSQNETLRLAIVTVDGLEMIDSVKLKSGKFEFKIPETEERYVQILSSPTMFQLFLTEENCLSTMAKSGEHIVINADASDLTKTYSISGGEEACLIHDLDSALLTFTNPVEDLYKIYEKNIENDSIREDIEAKYTVLLEKHREYLKSFIENHPYNMSSYVAFFQSYNRREFFNVYNDIEILRKINSNMFEKYPESEYVQSMMRIANMVEKNNNLNQK